MPRQVRDPSGDRRDWMTRAAEALGAANRMPEGPLRDEALRKAAQLRSAGELMGFLIPRETKSPSLDARRRPCKT